MKLFRAGAAALLVLGASYAQAAAPEGLLGGPLPSRSAKRPASKPIAPKVRTAAAARAVDGGAKHYATALKRLKPEGRATTRGAKEQAVYREASPSVVLVVSEDGLGSGVLISAEGQIVTNLHVVGGADEVGVVFKPADDRKLEEADLRFAKVLKVDEVADLALIQVEEVPAGVKPLAIGSAGAVEVGSDVHAIGHPTGETWTYTLGIVSQVRKDYSWSAEDKVPHTATVIQTQTTINPGNSGGPLIDDKLEVVGINSFNRSGEGLNYAVSADDVKAFLARSGDRLVKPEDKKPAACESETVLEEGDYDDPKGKYYLIDDNCDEAEDYVLIEPTDAKEPILLMFDEDGNGKVEMLIVDQGRDGKPDLVLYDTDEDDKPDLRGEYRNGEMEPYRVERISR
jgi:S1-C subfamily serine protease